MGETDENRYDVIFIMVIFLKCRVGARNDKSTEAVACTSKLVSGRDETRYKYEPSDSSVSK